MKKIVFLIFLTIFSNNFLVAIINNNINDNTYIRNLKIESLLDLLTDNDLFRLEKLLNISNFYLPVNILKKILGFWDGNINLKAEDIEQNFIILKDKNNNDQKISILEKSKNLLIKIIKDNIAVPNQLCGLTWEFIDIIKNDKIKNLSEIDQQKLKLINIDGLEFFIKNEYVDNNPTLIDDFANKFFNYKYNKNYIYNEKLINNNYDTIKFNLKVLQSDKQKLENLDYQEEPYQAFDLEHNIEDSYRKVLLEFFNLITEFYRIHSINGSKAALNRSIILNILSNISNIISNFYDKHYYLDKIDKKAAINFANNLIRLKFIFNDIGILKNNIKNKNKLLVEKNLTNLKNKQYIWLLINKFAILSSYLVPDKKYNNYNLAIKFLFNISENIRKYYLYKM